MSVASHLKKKFLAGFFIVIPLIVTAYVVILIVSFFDSLIGPVVKNILSHVAGKEIYVAGTGFMAIVVITYIVGILASNYFGKALLARGERLVKRIPVVKGIYGSVKDMTDAFSSDRIKSFQEVVLVEFPSPGSYAIGFVTKRIDIGAQHFCSVFIPLTPNPTASLLILVKEESLTFLDISADDALKYVISLGTVRLDSLWQEKV